MRRMPSMRARMTLAFAATIALLLLLGGGILARQRWRTAQKHAADTLETAAARVRAELREPDRVGTPLLTIAREEQGELATGNLALLVVQNGQIVWRSRAQAPSWPPDETENRRWRFQTVTKGAQTLVLALPWAETEAGWREFLLYSGILDTLLVAAAALGAWLVVGRTLLPIEDLSRQAQGASATRLGLRLEAPSPDAEIIGLVATFNDLLARLEGESAARGRFYAAASHELRTPLQALIGELDVILSRPRAAGDYQSALEEIRGQTLRLVALTQALLQLNQLETRPVSALQERVNAAELLERLLQHLAPQIAARGLEVHSLLPDAEISAPPFAPQMLFRNLLENAVQYAQSGGKVRVQLFCAPEVRLEIWNEAAIAPGERCEMWLEPFFRPESGRRLRSEGNGLGLAICAAVCDANGWDLELSPSEGGVCVRVVWPSVPRA